jgi:hypothetical protein
VPGWSGRAAADLRHSGPDHACRIILRRAGCWHCPGGASLREPIPVPVCGRAPAAPSGSPTPHSVSPASLPTMSRDCRDSPSIRVRSSRCRQSAIDTVVLSPLKHLSARRLLASHAVQCRQSEMHDYEASGVGHAFPVLDRLAANREPGRVRANPRPKSIHACGRFPV